MSIGRRNLLQDKTRFALSVAGVALAVMLVLTLNGLLGGVYRQISLYLSESPGSVVVAQDGVENFLGVNSLLPPGTADAAREAEEVSEVVPILSQYIIPELHGEKLFTYLVGYDPALGGGPWSIAEGREPRTDDEVVFDEVLARQHDVEIGDRIELVDRKFEVVGLSEDTASWMTNFVFVRKSAMESLVRAPGATSFLLVKPEGGTTAGELRDRLEGLPETEVLLKSKVIDNDLELFGSFSAPLRLMVGIAFFVGVLVVGLVIYTATVERQKEYGVLKAIGAKNRMLYGVVTVQALVAAGVGSVLGVGLAFGAARLISAVRPQFLVAIEPVDVVWALLAGLLMALLAALVPARTVARLAPAEVFRR